jgi:hypothetical protein
MEHRPLFVLVCPQSHSSIRLKSFDRLIPYGVTDRRNFSNRIKRERVPILAF